MCHLAAAASRFDTERGLACDSDSGRFNGPGRDSMVPSLPDTLSRLSLLPRQPALPGLEMLR